MDQSYILSLRSSEISLRTIVASDCEKLRGWKNENRLSFFFQELITPQMQEVWFRGYLERANDYMFAVQHANEVIGCMGFRLIDNTADIYNVILGDPEYGGKGYMSRAMALMCSYILSKSTKDIGLKVLRANPALKWYLKNGFYEVLAHDSYFDLKLDTKRFEPCKFQKAFYPLP
jgi:RimJ/RimL family protein N-acetyltransferase